VDPNVNNKQKKRKDIDRLKMAMEVATDGFWDWQVDTDEVFFDNRYYTMAGYEPDEFPGTFQEWEKRVHPEDLAQAKARLSMYFGSESDIYQADFRFQTKQNKWIWIRARGKAFGRDENGNPIRMIGTHTNITQIKQAEAIRQRSEESYRLLVENAHDSIFIAQDSVLKYANPSTEHLTGYSKEELFNISFIDFVHRNDKPFVMDLYQKRLMGQEATNYFTFKAINKSGEELFLEMNAVRIEWEAKPAILCFVRDGTQTKKLELQLVQAQKMEAIGTLAGGIAHDFNNILGAILGYTQLVQFHIPENSEAQDHIQQILKASHRAKGLVRQILAFSRQSKPEKIPVDISVIVKEVLKLLRASLPANIEINQNVKTALGTVMADQTQMHQVLINLCTNAFHAMENSGGSLEVTLAPVELSAGDAAAYQDLKLGRYLKLTVADSGCGMDASLLERIFDPYFTTKATGEGTGMGLATVHGIVEDHDGAIRVYSEPGSGTAFHVYLPCIDGEVDKKTQIPASLPTGSEQILFVDDEKLLVDIGKQMLKKLGYKVDGRTSPYEALEAFRANPDKFDMIVTDMTMPGMSGENFSKEILEIRSDTPIVICTGFSKVITAQKANEMGIKDFLMKPLTIQDLSRSVRNVLDQT